MDCLHSLIKMNSLFYLFFVHKSVKKSKWFLSHNNKKKKRGKKSSLFNILLKPYFPKYKNTKCTVFINWNNCENREEKWSLQHWLASNVTSEVGCWMIYNHKWLSWITDFYLIYFMTFRTSLLGFTSEVAFHSLSPECLNLVAHFGFKVFHFAKQVEANR